MQKVFFTVLFSAGLLLFGATTASAQHVYVKVTPRATVVHKPKAPSPHHVWVGAEWSERNGRYVESPAHWELPPAGHRAWVAGHWAHQSRGNYWVAGHWR